MIELVFGFVFGVMIAATAVAYITAWYGYIQRRRFMVYWMAGMAYLAPVSRPSIWQQLTSVLALWGKGEALPYLRPPTLSLDHVWEHPRRFSWGRPYDVNYIVTIKPHAED